MKSMASRLNGRYIWLPNSRLYVFGTKGLPKCVRQFRTIEGLACTFWSGEPGL